LAAEDQALAELVDELLFNGLMAATYLAQMGEDRAQFMEDVLGFREHKDGVSLGGLKGAETRRAWHAKSREVFNEYRRAHPDVTVMTRILKGMNRIRRIPESSELMLLKKLIPKWLAEEREKNGTVLDQVS
jgi:hypothetical protein